MSPAVQAILDSLPKPSPTEAKRRKAMAMIARARSMMSGIPGGQPICSTRDANRRAKSCDLMFQATAILKEIGDL